MPHADLVNIGRIHYNYQNGEEDDLHFEVVGSVSQFHVELERNLPLIENGQRRLGLIINIGKL